MAPHLDQRFGDGDHAGIGLGRCRRPEINAAVGVDNPLVLVACALGWRTSVQRLAHALGANKAFTSPGLTVASAGAGMGRQTGENQQQQQRSPAQVALARCHFHSRRSVTVSIRRCS